jgi:hypothetical protein
MSDMGISTFKTTKDAKIQPQEIKIEIIKPIHLPALKLPPKAIKQSIVAALLQVTYFFRICLGN